MTDFKFKLGAKVRDRISGIEGIVIGNTEWITGCNTINLKPQGLDPSGKPFESVGVDEPWLEEVKGGISLQVEKPADPKLRGGPNRVAQRGMR